MFNWLYKRRISRKRKKKEKKKYLSSRVDASRGSRNRRSWRRGRCPPSHGDVSSESIMLLDKLKRTLKAKCGRRTERNASCKTGWVDGGVEGG